MRMLLRLVTSSFKNVQNNVTVHRRLTSCWCYFDQNIFTTTYVTNFNMVGDWQRVPIWNSILFYFVQKTHGCQKGKEMEFEDFDVQDWQKLNIIPVCLPKLFFYYVEKRKAIATAAPDVVEKKCLKRGWSMWYVCLFRQNWQLLVLLPVVTSVCSTCRKIGSYLVLISVVLYVVGLILAIKTLCVTDWHRKMKTNNQNLSNVGYRWRVI